MSDSQLEELDRKIRRLETEMEVVEPIHVIPESPSSVREIGFAETQNASWRAAMEDGHCIIDRFRGNECEGYFGVYDGHGGRLAVDYMEKALHTNFEEALDVCQTVKDAYVYSFKKTDYGMKSYDVMQCGSTCVSCFLSEVPDERHPNRKLRKLFTANCGDARAVLSRNGRAQRLTYDHKCTDAREKRRIERLSGWVAQGRVGGVLAVSRSFGDHGLKNWVVVDPFYTEVDLLKTDDLLIIACDGIWDVIEDQQAVDLIRNEQTAQKMADLLMREALDRNSTDNISVMILILNDG